jgi:integrase
MTELRRRMEDDMVVRGSATRTRQSYLWAVRSLARFYHRPPDQISDEEVHASLVHLLRERRLSSSTCNVVVHGLRFFYQTTLKRARTTFDIPLSRQPSKLPVILSREEVGRLITHAPNPKYRAILLTAYAAGLRLNEVLHLRVADIDSGRMTIRVEQGKGAKDRYTVLSPHLLAELRRYWALGRPRTWLFPSQETGEPLHPTAVPAPIRRLISWRVSPRRRRAERVRRACRHGRRGRPSAARAGGDRPPLRRRLSTHAPAHGRAAPSPAGHRGLPHRRARRPSGNV